VLLQQSHHHLPILNRTARATSGQDKDRVPRVVQIAPHVKRKRTNSAPRKTQQKKQKKKKKKTTANRHSKVEIRARLLLPI
jgi:hypothetical protein